MEERVVEEENFVEEKRIVVEKEYVGDREERKIVGRIVIKRVIFFFMKVHESRC